MSNDGTNTPDPYGQPNYGQPNYGEQNPYGQAPGQGAPAPTGPMAQPSSIKTAVMLMRVGALLSLLTLLTAFLFRDDIRETVEKSLRDADAGVTADTIDAAVAVTLGISVFFGLLGVALWLWMASANGKGRSWARIVATIFFGISVLSNLVSLAQPQAGLQRGLGLVSLILGAVIIVLLWKKESTAYYNSVTASRAMH